MPTAGDAGRRLDARSTRAHDPTWSDPDFADGIVNPSRYSAAARPPGGAPAAADRTTAASCGGAITSIGTTSRPSRASTTSTAASQSFFGRYMATLHDQPVTFDENNLLTATADRQRLPRSRAFAGGRQQLGDEPDDGEREPLRLQRHPRAQAGRPLLQPRGRRHRAVDVGAGPLPAHRAGQLQLRFRAAGAARRSIRTSTRSATT